MARYAIKTLEFDKVKELLAAKTATSLGRAAALALQIEGDLGAARSAQEDTAQACYLYEAGKSLPFGGARDITALVKRAEIGGILEPQELRQIQNTALALGGMKAFLAANEELAPALAARGQALQPFTRLVRQIEGAIDEHSQVKDGASPKLRGLRSAIAIAKNRIREKLDSILHDPGNQKYFQDNLVTMRGDRYVLPIKQEYRLNFPGLVHDQSSTGATLFIEPLAVLNLNNDIKRYSSEEKAEVERILQQLSAGVGQDGPALLTGLQVLTELDLISAKALLAHEQHAARPQLLAEGPLQIQQGRHPLIPGAKVVPIDLSIGGEHGTVLVTGPNTGGKTVALKALGLFALMAQAGLFLPALSAQLPVFNAVYGDIGDEQSIEQSLSTFSAHMTNLVSILAQARPGDLVLLDEICAGTDPNEGAALAMAILQHFHQRGVWVMATTHYSELKTFAYSQPGMINASVEFDDVSLRPTYRLLLGVPGSSNAFNIAKRLGLEEGIVTAAGRYLNQEHAHMEDVLRGLEQERRQYESSSREAAALQLEARQLRNQLAAAKADFEKRRKELLRQAKEEADEIYRSSRREAEAVLKELRGLKADLDSQRLTQLAQEAREKLNKNLSEEREAPAGSPLTEETAKKGLTVFVTSLGRSGTIVGRQGQEVVVQAGILKLTVPLEKCLLTKAQPLDTVPREFKTRKRGAGYGQQILAARLEARQELDLRGLTLAEAVAVVEKAMDRAILSGVNSLRLVHGKGTGALKAGLLAYLEGNPYVRQLRPASLEEGGGGVTIVDL